MGNKELEGAEGRGKQNQNILYEKKIMKSFLYGEYLAIINIHVSKN